MFNLQRLRILVLVFSFFFYPSYLGGFVLTWSYEYPENVSC